MRTLRILIPFIMMTRVILAQEQFAVEKLLSAQTSSSQGAPSSRPPKRPQGNYARLDLSLPSQTFPSVFVDDRVRVSLSAPDVARLRNEVRDDKPNQPPRVGISRVAALSTAKDGRWINLGSDGRAWVMSVTSPGAIAVRAHFVQFSLPKGARLFQYSPSNDQRLETFDDRGPFGDGDFWSPSVPGDTVILELLDPSSSSDTEQPKFFEIAEIGHIYQALQEPRSTTASSGGQAQVGGCHLDATCYPEWSASGDAVALIDFFDAGFFFSCSGTLLHNIAGDLSPLFLTANHCIPNERVARTVEAYFFYEASACNALPPDLPPATIGARFLAGQARTDFTLLEILGTLPLSEDSFPTFAEWASAEVPYYASVSGIHHPGGSFRRISFGSIDPSSDPNYHEVEWSSGTIERGSSGSGLFNASGQIVGQASAANDILSCNNSRGRAYYGKFSRSYPAMLNPQGQHYLQVGLGDDSQEPNETRATASILVSPVSLVNLVVKDTGNGQGEDWYRIRVPANYLIDAQGDFTHSWGDIDLELYRGSETAPVSSSHGVFNSERIGFQSGSTVSDYFLRVFLVDDTRNTYNLSINLRASNPVPVLSGLSPSSATALGTGFTLTVNGSNFLPGSIVRWNGSNRDTSFVSNTQLRANVSSSDIATVGTNQVTILNPEPGGGVSNPVSFAVTNLAPAINPGGTLNGASFTLNAPVSPGSIASAFGSNLGATLPTVRMNDIPVPLFAATPSQINFQVPWELGGQSQATLTVSVGTLTSSPATVSLAPLAPGIFSTSAAGSGQGVILIANTPFIAAPEGRFPGSQPVNRGGFLSIYATGLGEVTNQPATGVIASDSSRTVITPTILIGGVPAEVSFSGLAPGFFGLYQVNAQVPLASPSGEAVPVVLTIGGITSNTVTIAVQ